MMPMLAGLSAFLAIILHFAGVEGAAIPMVVLTVALAGVGLVSPGEEKGSGRVFCILSIVGAATPFLADAAKSFRLRQLEDKRAAETAPMYATLATIEKQAAPAIEAYFTAHSIYPELGADGMPLPVVFPDGNAYPPPPVAGMPDITDPFSQSRKLRGAAVRGQGVLLASVGQDGVAEMPLPGPPLDAEPADPLVPFATTGVDMRLVTYDPTNGSLGLGDPVVWVGRKPRAEVFAPLDQAWTLAAQRSPLMPPPEKGIPPERRQSDADGAAAQQLYTEGKLLAALALACRAIPERPPSTTQWTPAEAHASALKGIILYMHGHNRAAVDALGDHLSFSPNDAEAHFYAGAASHAVGDTQRAKLHYAAAAYIDPNSAYAQTAEESLARIARGEAPIMPPLAK